MKISLSYTLAKEYQALAKLSFLDDHSADRMEQILVMAEFNSLLSELLSQVDLDIDVELDCLCQYGFDSSLKLKPDYLMAVL
jgi:hypothetical protein